MVFDPDTATFDALDLELDLNYTSNDVVFLSESVIAYPGTWVWQAFSACGDLGAYAFESSILFGASTAEYLYAEAILSLPIAGISFAFHAAQLSSAVFGGSEGGCALQLSGGIGGFDFVGVTEFGAMIEDAESDGISIIHMPTGLERHYSTDPRPAGGCFTGQKLSLRQANIFCSELVTGTLYISHEGFEFGQIEMEGVDVGFPLISLDTELRFELAEKTFTIAPTVSLGELACLEAYGHVDWDVTSLALDAFRLSGLEAILELGPVVIRDVALFDLDKAVLTTAQFGSRVMLIDDVLEAGCEYYPDYWGLLSIAVATDDCCGAPYSFLANAYFEDASSGLLDWAMLYVEASIPLASQLDISFGMDTKPSGIQHIAVGIGVTW